MALDTRYRPLRFEDVIGQENTVTVLRQFVKSGSGFHQSYLFCGGHGSGKTTLGRILARALLCENPQEGNPCDACLSCRSILERGSNECFVEIDAATNSSKDDVKAITDALQYDTFSGRRRIYLFDEAHRLSKDALDALLKPMEDTAPGSEDKMLICIFCTTEPEKMRSTIRSRCAPAFVIRRVSSEGIADRLAYVCDKEGIAYERAALVIVAEAVEAHIRDALKSVEGVSQLGAVDVANVKNYLRLNANASYLSILVSVGFDLPRALRHTQELQEVVSPGTAYERLAELAMLAYRTVLGVGKPPSYWNEAHIRKLGAMQENFLVKMAQVLSSKPGHPTFSMLECDLTALHFERRGEYAGTFHAPAPTRAVVAPPIPTQMTAPVMAEEPAPDVGVPTEGAPEARAETADAGRVTQPTPAPTTPPPSAGPITTKGGVYIDPRAVRKRDPIEKRQTPDGNLPPLGTIEFRTGLRRLVNELAVNGRGLRPAG